MKCNFSSLTDILICIDAEKAELNISNFQLS